MTADRPDVAILGGGMGGLATAWRLTDADVGHRVGTVTVYQRGHRLGGKAASHRGVHGRIEEHGLHVWLGYYDNAFRLIREVYEELDREHTDPRSPIRTWRDAFAPAPLIGLEDLHEGDWSTWTAVFPTNDRLPGEPLTNTTPASAPDVLRQSARLMASFVTSLGGPGVDLGPGLALGVTREARRLGARLESMLPLAGGLEVAASAVEDALTPLVQRDPRARRLWHLVDLVAAQLRGLIADDLLSNGFRSIDHLEYRDWISRHGASRETSEGALVRGLYDLAFSHRGGDPTKTEFPAGLGLFLATKTFFDYRGALFWKMQAGMGDVVIAPLYQALRRRGVRFEFFSRVDEVLPSSDGAAVDRVVLGRQAELAEGLTEYEPLQDFSGMACFPDSPDADQLRGCARDVGTELESFWCTRVDVGVTELRRGRDFDELVFAIPVGMAPHVAPELIALAPAWQQMVELVETVGTQAFQLWLTPTEEELGWNEYGSTVTSYVDSYDTWSSMSHLIAVEDWPPDHRPGTIAYFCSSMPHEPDDRGDPDAPARALARARQAARQYLERDVGHYWPNAMVEGGFRWDLLAGASTGSGAEALDTQFVTANVDPSDRYVQALPGTDHARLRPDESGFRHLHLAGDWTDCGLNAGCIEAAVLSGIGAANSILGLPRGARISGGYLL